MVDRFARVHWLTTPLAKVAVTQSRIHVLDAALARAGAARRYGAAGSGVGRLARRRLISTRCSSSMDYRAA